MNPKDLQKELTRSFYRGNGWWLALSIVSSLALGSLNIIVSWLMKELIDTASGVEGAYPVAYLLKLSIAFVLLMTVLFLIQYAAKPRFVARAMEEYRRLAFEKLSEKSIASFQQEKTSTYLSALTNDATTIEDGYLEGSLSLVPRFVSFAGSLVLMLVYSPTLFAIAMGLTILPFISSMISGNRLAPVEARVSEKNRNFTAILTDALNGFSVIKSFRAEKELYALFKAQSHELECEKYARRRLVILLGMIGAVTGVFAQLGVFIAGTILAIRYQTITAGVVIAFVNLMNFVIEPIASLPGLIAKRKAAKKLIERLADALAKHPTVTGEVEMDALEDAIRLENISFAYDEDHPVLKGIDAEFEAGKSYALVGASGSGKSTLLKLIGGWHPAYTGNVTMDGHALETIRTDALYKMISFVEQNVFLFDATMKENITMFRSFPEEEIERAMKLARLEDLMKERGEEMRCGEGGTLLSGGQKARISIARSLMKNSSVLLADEITASLDAETAHGVTSDLLDLMDVTRIIVTHRLEKSLLERFDGILVMKDGRIVEHGKFHDLMDEKGYFYALYTVAA